MLGASITAAGCVADGSETAPSTDVTAPTSTATQATTTTTPSAATPSETDVRLPWWNDRVFYEILVVVGVGSIEPLVATPYRPFPILNPFGAVVGRFVAQT